MANVFDSANYPDTEPTELRLGDRWAWKRTDLGTDYPPASYALTYSMQLLGDGNHTILVTASESGTDYVIEVPSATTAGYIAGDYRWYLFITRSSDSQRVNLATGTLSVKENTASGHHDESSHAEVMVRKIELVLNGRADADVMSYSIAGRSLSKMSPDELVQWRDYYLAEVAKERRAEAIKLGKGVNSKILARFTN